MVSWALPLKRLSAAISPAMPPSCVMPTAVSEKTGSSAKSIPCMRLCGSGAPSRSFAVRKSTTRASPWPSRSNSMSSSVHLCKSPERMSLPWATVLPFVVGSPPRSRVLRAPCRPTCPKFSNPGIGSGSSGPVRVLSFASFISKLRLPHTYNIRPRRRGPRRATPRLQKRRKREAVLRGLFERAALAREFRSS